MKNIRMCIVCKTRKDKFEMYRIINENEKCKIDKTYKTNSRGMYICKNCIKKGLKKIEKIKTKISKNGLEDVLEELNESI